MKKRQIKKNSKKIADEFAEYASAIKGLESLGVFSINYDYDGNIECHVRSKNLVKLPFAKPTDFKFNEFDEGCIRASIEISGLTFFALVDSKERAEHFPGELDVRAYE